MPPKKRDKEAVADVPSKIGRDHQIQAEHELFLQAFEKPTQIYRYLRTRNMISPIFLHRTLTYMKHRMSRNHKRRTDFKVDTMLANKINKTRMDRANGPGNYMNILFLGFFDKSLCDDNKIHNMVRVETTLLKISHKKRKDSSSALMQIIIGSSDVDVNPIETNENRKIPAVSIPSETFKNLGGGTGVTGGASQSQSYILVLSVETLPRIITISDNEDEPNCKKVKPNTKMYASELVIFDKHNRCLLSEGEYELALQEIITNSKNCSPKKHSTWEVIPEDSGPDVFEKLENPFILFSKCPTLKFFLKWTQESCPKFVERPKPICLRDENKINDQKLMKNTMSNSLINEISTISNTTGVTRASITNSILNCSNGNATSTLKMITEKVHKIGNELNHNNNNINSLTNTTYHNGNGIKEEQLVPHPGDCQQQIQIVYQFTYNNNSRQQTEPCDDMICPWCSLDCITLYSLLKHLKLCHARFVFTYVPMPNGGARIDVAINDMYDGSYTGSPHDLVGPAGCAFARAGPVRRTIVTNLLVCRPRRQKPNLSEFLELDENELNNQRPYITGHNRLYHHTETCLPVHPKELDIDSEGESDPLWLQHKTMQMIDEFTDVNEGEKELMKMWNLHVMKHGFVGDCQLPLACDMFLDLKGRELLYKNLYRNFVLHMCSLLDYGLVSPEVVYKTIQKLQTILSTYPESRKVISESREAQVEYWLKIGMQKQSQKEEYQQKQQQQQEKQEKQSQQGEKSNAVSSNTSKKLTNEEKTGNEKMKESNKMSGTLSNVDTATSGNRKKSLNSLTSNSEHISTNKRRLSQLRDSPPRRRSTSQPNGPKKLSTINRRKSLAVVTSNSGNSGGSAMQQQQAVMKKRLSVPPPKLDKN